ncbi:sigma-70 family RNA polymerase sigma factor [Cyanobium gracile]|uniref:Sigma-70 family RNA polymerase sigma factor n=1 Tax=Cyanobium gracile UHCC 0281 TaxID=3110309 RepID=A0ABU5STE2_9CYAN|nr:sigma-70 family RNA polymerase sigma factor [Cyanobium gracile]MEA5441635.1 sigma-70 family RNA polymerase sigma factor [Cyanobium gracile UHCC 0281]
MDRPPPPPPPAPVLLATRRTPQPDFCAGCRDIPEAIVDRRSRNRRRLKAYAEAIDPLSRLRWRNLVVEDNLPLVFSIAGRQGVDPGLAFEDLAQVGSLGLIRAVEAFDPDRNVSLSSFAVPYIQGAIRRERRDRQPMVRPPRPLWDLHQQVLSLQEARRRKGLEPLTTAALADRLACDPARLEEALQVRSVGRVRSLDAPLGQAGGDSDAAGCLLDLLASPAAPGGDEELAIASEAQSAERQWLRQQLADLDPRERQLLVGRIDVGCTWVELGRQLGIPARQAQRRCDAVLDRLRRAALVWRQQALSPPQATATAPAPSPAAPPAASGAR